MLLLRELAGANLGI